MTDQLSNRAADSVSDHTSRIGVPQAQPPSQRFIHLETAADWCRRTGHADWIKGANKVARQRGWL
jgi:hypothetical protein